MSSIPDEAFLQWLRAQRSGNIPADLRRVQEQLEEATSTLDDLTVHPAILGRRRERIGRTAVLLRLAIRSLSELREGQPQEEGER